jgi:transposase-like protein
MLGFKRFRSASIVIAGIELVRRIYKSQFDLSKLGVHEDGASAIWNAVLAA